MEMRSVVSIMTESVTLLGCAFIVLFLMSQKERERLDNTICWMLGLMIGQLVCDMIANIYRGDPGHIAGYVLWASRFLMLLSAYLIFVGFGVYLRESLKLCDPSHLTLWRVVQGMMAVTIVLLILSQFGGFLYYYDENNVYHRGKLFLLMQLAPMTGRGIYLWMILANRRKVRKNEFIVLSMYLLLPFFSNTIQVMLPDFPVQTVSGGIACWGVFLAREVTIRNQLSKAMREKEEKRVEAEEALAALQAQFRVLKSIAESYYSMHLLDLEKDSVTELYAQNEVLDRGNRPSGAGKAMYDTISLVTAEQWREEALRFTELSTVAERMQGKKEIAEEFVGKNLGWYRARFIAVETDAGNRPTKVVFATRIIDEEKRQREALTRKAQIDEMSGFYNRRVYEEDVEKYRDHPLAEDFAYISFDANGLKGVNDTLGHAAGDEMLIGVSSCIMEVFGQWGRLYRTGGDEFVFMGALNAAQYKEMTQRFDKITGQWSGKQVKKLSVSYGAVFKRECPEASIEELAIQADKKMYEFKRTYYQINSNDRRASSAP